MSFIRSIRSRFSGQSFEEFGEGQRFPLSKELIIEIRRHIAQLAQQDLTGYTFERRRSEYPRAKSDLIIYDADGKRVLEGREMSAGVISFWSK